MTTTIARDQSGYPQEIPSNGSRYVSYRLYCVVVEHSQALPAEHPLRRGGFSPTLSDEEVITMEICGEYFKWPSDKDIWEYFRTYYRYFSLALGDRTLFVRQAANLWQMKAAIPQRLAQVSDQATDPIQPIAAFSLPICVYTRSGQDRCFKPYADYGYCAAKQMDYYGFKLGLCLSRLGIITQFPCWRPAPITSTTWKPSWQTSWEWHRLTKGSWMLTNRRCERNDMPSQWLRHYAPGCRARTHGPYEKPVDGGEN